MTTILSPNDFQEIYLNIEKNQQISCNVCGLLFTKDSLKPNQIVCKNGHNFTTYNYVPKFEIKDDVIQSLWVIGENFSFEQLKLIRELFNLSDLPLIEIKKKFISKEYYLLLQNSPSSVVEEKAEELSKRGIKFIIK
jgi:hypothetical protein